MNKLGKLLPTIIYILIAVIVSMMLLSYFNINMNSSDSLRLNRFAIFEGNENMLKDEEDEEEKKIKETMKGKKDSILEEEEEE